SAGTSVWVGRVLRRWGWGRTILAPPPPPPRVPLARGACRPAEPRLSQHPFERALGQAALLLWITATDIAMHAREPNLLDVSWSPGCGRTPEIWSKERASFVDRYRVTANLNIRVVCGVG